MTSPGNHILPHYDAALNAIRLRVNAICGSLLKYMDILEQVISGPDSDGANGIIADGEPLSEETRQVLSLCAAVLTRAAYEQLAREHPAIVQRLLTNLALALAARVRSANQLATARQRRHP